MARSGSIKQAAKTIAHSKRLRLLVVVLIILGLSLGVAIVPLESRSARGGNILTYEDGLWWSITTITGVGFGDLYPVTTAGRIVGALLEVFGVVLFGAVIAVLSVSLLRYQDDYYMGRMMERLDQLDGKIDGLSKKVEYMIKGEKKSE